ncbi:MAG: respiratory nitrate reductase subunit gamma, partial [Candidatus Latescibacterota bacterium]
MSTFAFVVGGILPALAIVIFIVGMAYRFRTWIKTPQPGKMTLFPANKNAGKAVIAEAVFFPSLFRGDRTLWVFAWIFHVTLALIALGHIRVVTGLIDRTLLRIGMTQQGINTMSSVVGGIAGVIILLTGILLLLRRLSLQRVREISGLPDFFALLLLVAIIVTGDLMRFASHLNLETTRIWVVSLLSFSPQIPQHGMFLLHLTLACALIMYIPFSKILHFGG